jgi:hypothetical protein
MQNPGKLLAGKSEKDSTRLALSHAAADMIMEDGTLKRLAQEMGDLQTQELASGDTASLQNLAQTGMNLGDQLSSGDSGKYIANQIVGNSIEAVAIAQLDPNTSYDFLGGETPSQVLQEIKQQKLSMREMTKNFDAVYSEMTEEEENSYFERSKIYGEADAMRWVLQQHPPNSSQNGQQ